MEALLDYAEMESRPFDAGPAIRALSHAHDIGSLTTVFRMATDRGWIVMAEGPESRWGFWTLGERP